jgi:hypothetical protein
MHSVEGSTRLYNPFSRQCNYKEVGGNVSSTLPPFFQSAGRGTTKFWGNEQGPTFFLWDGLGERDEKNANG